MNGKILPGDMHEHTHTTLGTLFHGFIHPTLRPRPAVDQAVVDSAAGRAAVFRATLVLGAVALAEFVIAAFFGSAALAADGVHALAAAATAIPVFVAAAPIAQETSKFFSYGRERAEDLLAVMAIVAIGVLAFAVLVFSLVRLVFLTGGTNPAWIGAGGAIGLAGAVAAAVLRLSAARTAGSQTLSADGRALGWNGVTAAIVIAAAFAVAAGAAWADSLAGAIVAVIVLRNLWRAAQQATTRLIDGIEEDLTWRIARAAEEGGAENVTDVRARWTGHRLHAEVTVGAPSSEPLGATRALAGKVRASVAQKFPQLKRVAVNVVPVDAPAAGPEPPRQPSPPS
jgi:cation diffusion facilitator family transporter